jgi:hypothetical protein
MCVWPAARDPPSPETYMSEYKADSGIAQFEDLKLRNFTAKSTVTCLSTGMVRKASPDENAIKW